MTTSSDFFELSTSLSLLESISEVDPSKPKSAPVQKIVLPTLEPGLEDEQQRPYETNALFRADQFE